ncbi:MAG: Uncharacterized protein Athens101410_46 [Parcubacteria group bacterium Athens1014_10]|nr:MAG: Uncharacterized protein Athens101410_46 [Parcubacteria group bacterium Athens1014_10]
MRGFTLTEIIIAVSLLTLVVLMVCSFIIQSYRTWDLIQIQGGAQEQIKTELNKITKEMRKAQMAETGAYPIKEASPLSLTFYANIDSDPEIEQIRYFPQGTNLIKGIIKPTGNPPAYSSEEQIKIIASSVRNDDENPIFSYFDENYTGAEEPLSYPLEINQIRLIKINLIVDVDTEKNPPPYILETEVNLRNLKTNI